ncbi:MAG: glycosyltransferase family 4 protein [Spirochaetota bacterium]
MTATAAATLIAPSAGGRLSGGFLVNLAWTRSPFLRAEEATTAGELDALLSAHGDRLTLVDSLYLYDAEAASVLARAARSRPVALVAHSLPSLIPGPPVDERREMLENERAFLACACGAIAPSRFMADALARRGLARETVQIVRPAPIVDGRARHPETSPSPVRTGPPRILTVANWTPAKGIDHAVRALATLGGTDWRWTLVGSAVSHPEYSRRVRDLIEEEGLAGRVKIVRPRPPEALRSYYARSDVFLLPSLMESYGLVFTEAIEFGLPVVGYRCAAVGEVASSGGDLVDAGDLPGLAAAIRTALERAAELRGRRRTPPVTLPDHDTSGRELAAALHSLDRSEARQGGRR